MSAPHHNAEMEAARFEVGTAPDRKAFSIMDSKAKERAELLFHKRQDERALSEYQAKVQATRELTANYARNDWPAKQWASLKPTGNPKTERMTVKDATIVALAAAKVISALPPKANIPATLSMAI